MITLHWVQLSGNLAPKRWNSMYNFTFDVSNTVNSTLLKLRLGLYNPG